MAELFVMSGICQGTVFFLPDAPTALGRSPECQIQIVDPWVSSMHAMFERRGEELWLVDLESRNGTWVGEQRVREAPLTAGTRLRFGKTVAEIREGQTPRAIVPLLNEHGTIVRYLADIQAEARQSMEPAPLRDTEPGAMRATIRGPVSRRQVAVLNDMGRALVDAPDLDGCLARILATITAAVRAEHATLLLSDPHGRMVARATYPEGSPPRTSEAVVAAAARSRAGLLTVDALQEHRHPGSPDGGAQDICSCLSVPVWAENRILGILLLDRGVADPFGPDDLDLVTVVGYQAALVIERTRFLERSALAEGHRRELLRQFSPHVTSLLVAHEQSDRDPLEPRACEEVTVLVAGAPELQGLSASVTPAELATLMREHLQGLADAVLAEDGTLTWVHDGGVEAAWNAPLAQPDGAARALRAAAAMLRSVEEANHRRPGARRLSLRVGVATGRATCGRIGLPGRTGFAVVGEAVEVARQLEAMAAAGTVYAARPTVEQAGRAFAAQDLGRRVARGREAPVEVFQVTGTGAER